MFASAAKATGMMRALGAAGDHDVDVAMLDEALRLDEGLHARPRRPPPR